MDWKKPQRISWWNKNKRYIQFGGSVNPGVFNYWADLPNITFPEIKPSANYLLTGIYLGKCGIVRNALPAGSGRLDSVILNFLGFKKTGLTATTSLPFVVTDGILRLSVSPDSAALQNLNMQIEEQLICDVEAAVAGGTIASDTLTVELCFEFEYVSDDFF